MSAARQAAGPLAALAVSVAMALWVAWPAPFDRGAVIGHWNHPDGLSNHWLLVWVAEQVTTGGSLLHNDRYYWPVGDAPMLAGNGGEGVLYVPFHLLWGWPVGVSAYAVAVLVGNGLAAAWAARRAGATWPGACVAAPFGAGPYVLQEMGSGRFTQSDVLWLTLVIGWFLGLERDLREGRPAPPWWHGLGFGALWGVCAALYWYYGYFAVLAVLATGLVHLLAGWKPAATAGVGRLAAAFVAGAVAVSGPPLAWYLANWSSVVGTKETVGFPHREAWGDSLAWTVPIDMIGAHQGFAIAVPMLLLAGFAVHRGARERSVVDLQLVVLIGFALLLARGPRLLGEAPDLYTVFYGWAEPLRRFWWPSRHLVLAQLAVALLAARGASALLSRIPRFEWAVAVGLAASVPLSLQLTNDLARLPMSRWETPAFYVELGELPDGVVAELPLSPRLSGHQQLLVYQLVHGKTLLNGHAMWVDRVRPDEWDARVEANSFLRSWIVWEEGQADGLSFEEADLRALSGDGLRWITLNREYVPKTMREPYEQALRELFGAPVVEDGRRAAVWDLQAWTGASELTLPRMRLDPGTRPANGLQPLVGTLPESLGFHVVRDTSKPFQGLHPSGKGQPAPGATPRPR
jgi:hypothetical protein